MQLTRDEADELELAEGQIVYVARADRVFTPTACRRGDQRAEVPRGRLP